MTGTRTRTRKAKETAAEAVVQDTKENTPVTDTVQETEGQEQTAPAEAKKTNAEVLAETFPEGTLVEFTKSEWIGSQGKVQGVEIKLNVPYLQVAVEVTPTGLRRKTEKSVLTRGTSVIKVDEYRAAPESKPAPEQAATEDAQPSEG